MPLITGFQVGDSFNLKEIRTSFEVKPSHGSGFELFYKHQGMYFYVLNYGVVVFANASDEEQIRFLTFLEAHTVNPLRDRHSDTLKLERGEGPDPVFTYHEVIVPEITDDVVRIAMLQVAQSVALDHFNGISQNLFNDTAKWTLQLEREGRIKARRKVLMKFIGRTLNTKNRIIDNLYVIDVPPVVWESELARKVNEGLVKTFDIATRFREIEYVLKIIESNLTITVDYINNRSSNRLEWIIIILILIEVLHTGYDFIMKFP